jgi:hypothetical protein
LPWQGKHAAGIFWVYDSSRGADIMQINLNPVHQSPRWEHLCKLLAVDMGMCMGSYWLGAADFLHVFLYVAEHADDSLVAMSGVFCKPTFDTQPS